MAQTPRDGSRNFSIARLVPSVYLPSLVFAAALGAIIPVIAVSVDALGGSLAMAGLVVTLFGVGHIIGDIPAGALASKFGDRRAMLVSAVCIVVALAVCALAPTLWLFGVGVVATGAVSSVFNLARQAYLTEAAPALWRARALSTLGGVQRIGSFIGPFLGALAIHAFGTAAAYWLAAALCLVAAVVVLVVPDVVGDGGVHTRPAHVPLRTVLREQRAIFSSLGIAVLAVGAVRGARVAVLPLWSVSLGFSPTTTSLVFALSGAVDMLLFYPAGRVMDLRGRLWVGVPSMLALGVALALLPFATTVAAVSAVAVALGIANGVGSGVIMTLGADVAPADRRSQFLGVWRLLADTGNALGPLVLAGGAAVGSLAAGIWVMSGVSFGASGALARWVPRWSAHAGRRRPPPNS